MTVSSIIYCTDCHASDGTGAPQGPHGSIYPQILIAQYLTANNTTESVSAYALATIAIVKLHCSAVHQVFQDIASMSKVSVHLVLHVMTLTE